MTVTIRPSNERGHFDHGWLDTYHTFSFADYHDPHHIRFGPLRVINEDRVAPGGGFPTHPHRDMEIITYVISGTIVHKDSTGGQAQVGPAGVQAMSAGSGLTHSEFNGSPSEPVHLLQIWIIPDEHNHTPRFAQLDTPTDQAGRALRLVASRDGRDGSLPINRDAEVWAGDMSANTTREWKLPRGEAWVQVANGAIELNAHALKAGDGAGIRDEDITIRAADDAELVVLIFPRGG